MAYTYNPNTRRFEDENGNPAPAEGVPVDEIKGAPPQAKPFKLDADEGVPLDAIQRTAPQTPVEIKRPDGTVSGEKPAETLQRRGGATAQTASLTSHVGGTSVNTPIGPEGIVQRTSGGSSVSKPIVTDEERKANKERDDREAEIIRKAEEKERVRAAAAEVAAGERALIQIQKQNDVERVGQAGDAELKRLMATAQDEEARWKQAALESTDARNTFWARQDTLYKIRAGIAMILGVVGGALTDGRNSGVEAVEKTIMQDEARFRQKAEMQEKILARSRGDVTEARAKIKEQLENIGLRTAVAFETAAAQAEARARKLGIDEESIKANAQIQALYANADKERAKWFDTTRGRVTTESARTIATGQAGAAGKVSQGERDAAGSLQQVAEKVQQLEALPIISNDGLNRIQNNVNELNSSEKSANSGGLSGLLAGKAVSIGRRAGVLSRGQFDGVSQQDRNTYATWSAGFAAIMKDISGATVPEEEVRRLAGTFMPAAGDSPADQQRKRQAMREYVQNAAIKAGRLQPTVDAKLGGGPASPATPTAQAAPSGPPVPGAVRKTHKTAGPGWLAPDGMFYTDAEIAQMAAR